MLHEGTKTEDAQEGSDGIKAQELALRSFMDHQPALIGIFYSLLILTMSQPGGISR